MELLESLRLNIGTAKLEKKLASTKRIKLFSNFAEVKRIGIVWDASNLEDFSKLSEFYQKMNSRNILVEILGYYKGKELPDKYTAVRYLKCFKNKDINIFYIPVANEVMEFINTPFDILIDLNFHKLFPLRYVSILSSAKLKVGLFEAVEEKSPFDLMMEIKNYSDIDNFITQAVYYLEMINGSENSSDISNQRLNN
jgi:hypothetical protein